MSDDLTFAWIMLSVVFVAALPMFCIVVKAIWQTFFPPKMDLRAFPSSRTLRGIYEVLHRRDA